MTDHALDNSIYDIICIYIYSIAASNIAKYIEYILCAYMIEIFLTGVLICVILLYHHAHLLCVADLIMLGLATHEPNFTIIREEFKQSKPRPCEICNQEGHSMEDCTGATREKSGEVRILSWCP